MPVLFFVLASVRSVALKGWRRSAAEVRRLLVGGGPVRFVGCDLGAFVVPGGGGLPIGCVVGWGDVLVSGG